jgi:hypothetical protein
MFIPKFKIRYLTFNGGGSQCIKNDNGLNGTGKVNKGVPPYLVRISGLIDSTNMDSG